MPGVVPPCGDGDYLPRFLVEVAGAVAGIVTRPETPRPTDRIDLPAPAQGWCRLTLHGAGCDRAALDGGDRQRALEHRKAVCWELRQVIREHGQATRDCDERGPCLCRRTTERWPYQQAIRVIEPGRALVEAPQTGRARRWLYPNPARRHVRTAPLAVHEARGMQYRRPARDEKRLGAQAVADRAQPRAICLRMRQPTVMRRAHCRPAQQIDSDVVVAPDLHDATCQVEQPLLNLRMGTVERVHRAAPRFTGLADHGARELGPRAPSSGSDRLPQALLIDAGRRHEQGGEGLQAVSIRVEAQMHARRVAFGSQGPGRAPVADRLEALRRELDARLAWL